jgi:hypothetical protein
MAQSKRKLLCFDEIREVAGKYIADSEIKRLIREMRKKAKAEQYLGSLERSTEAAANVMKEENTVAAIIEKRNAALMVVKKHAVETKIASFGAKPWDGIQAVTVGTSKSRNSVDARGKSYARRYLGGLVSELRRSGLLDVWQTSAIDREIAMELGALDRGASQLPGWSGSKEAEKIATIVRKYQDLKVRDLNASGAWIGDVHGYVERQTHDPGKMLKAGYEKWRAWLDEWLDFDRTLVDVEPGKEKEFFEGVFQGLVTGMHLKVGGTSDKMSGFKGPANLAKKLSEERVLHFKGDGEGWYQYNKAFGRGNLNETIVSSFVLGGKQKALLEVFGPNPRYTYDQVIYDLKVKNRDNPKAFKKLSRKKYDDFFAEIDGSTSIRANESGAKWGAGVRAWASMSKLGMIIWSSINDLPNMVQELHRNGINPIEGYARTLGQLFQGRTTGEMREIADLAGVGFDSILGSIHGRWSAIDDVPGALRAGHDLFFSLTGMNWWNDTHKTGIVLSLNRNLALKKNMTFDKLGRLADNLSIYDVDSGKWDMVRGLVRRTEDGMEFFDPSLIRSIPDDAVRAYMIEQGVDKSKIRGIQKFKDDLENQMSTYIIDRVDNAVLEPGARERSLWIRGTQPGTLWGEVARFISQFKMFPTAMVTKVLGQDIARRNYLGLAHIMAATWVMGYLSMAIKDMLKGKTPRDPTQASTMVAAFLQGGGAGIFGDFMFSDYSRFGRSFSSSVLGPVLGNADDVVEIFQRMKRGDDFGSNAFKIALNNTPFINLYYSRIAMDYLFLYAVQDHLNPGYLRRMERRIKEENKQDYLFPPSRYAVGVR